MKMQTTITSGIPIYHLASHARAGETLCLKLMESHSRVHVPVQITEHESKLAQQLVKEIKQTGTNTLEVASTYAKQHQLDENSVILIKQGVWQHAFSFNGFSLIRNPFSFVESMLTYNEKEGLEFGLFAYSAKKYKKTLNRLVRWSKDMSPTLEEAIAGSNNIVKALCEFYEYRVSILESIKIPLFRYEELVDSPIKTITDMCSAMNITYENQMLSAHEKYDSQEVIGHGMNDLTRNIDQSSLEKWRRLDKKTIDLISSSCSSTLSHHYNNFKTD